MSVDTNRQKIINLRRRLVKPAREGEIWSEEELNKLFVQYSDGTEITEIALDLERSEYAIFQQIAKNKLNQCNRRNIKDRKTYCKCVECICDKAHCPKYNSSKSEKEGQ